MLSRYGGRQHCCRFTSTIWWLFFSKRFSGMLFSFTRMNTSRPRKLITYSVPSRPKSVEWRSDLIRSGMDEKRKKNKRWSLGANIVSQAVIKRCTLASGFVLSMKYWGVNIKFIAHIFFSRSDCIPFTGRTARELNYVHNLRRHNTNEASVVFIFLLYFARNIHHNIAKRVPLGDCRRWQQCCTGKEKKRREKQNFRLKRSGQEIVN